MEWTASIKRAIHYMEQHLLDNISADEIAEEVAMSPFYLQKGFKFMTGYSLGEYIRNRRLYLAALEVIAGQDKMIELAYKYRYDTPESFTKAFHRFHGCSPMQLKKDRSHMQVFLPLKIKISIQGGNDMDYIVEKMKGFQVIGFEREFDFETSYLEIPKFWDEVYQNKIGPLFAKEKPENEVEQTICDCCIGEYGICIDDIGKEGKFNYMIAGTYHGGVVPEGMKVFEFQDMEWAKFSCVGPMPGALQAVNTKVFDEWLPGNTEFEIGMGANIEWYSGEGKTSDVDYKSGIWIPVVRK